MPQTQIQEARSRLLAVEKKLNQIVIGHDNMIRALMLALVSREHVVFIGPPGIAKSYTVHTLARLLNAKFYRYLLTRFTDYSELFGAIDVRHLAERGEYKRNWSDIVRADIVFLDEVFKANSAILNALLSLLQERIVYDPMSGQPQPAALWTAVGASNETPQDEELRALYDRFAIRVFEDYIDDDVMLLRALEARWNGNGVNIQPIATMSDVKTMHQYAITLLRAKVKQLGHPVYKIYHVNAVPILKSLRSRGVLVSDRTIIEKFPKLYASYLALYGLNMDNLMNAIFDLLPYLASDRSQLNDIRKAINEALGEVADLASKLEEAKKLAKAGNIDGALQKLEEILSYDVNRLASKPWLKPRAEAIIKLAKQYHAKLEEIKRRLQSVAEAM